MRIKKLIIKGFKSFANKTIIEFNDGVTAIVGPNGSGKSNIIEAIRWVMGEQSAKSLRGGRMNDVIFSGTEKRHPLNLASVEMIMDNADHFLPLQFEEVSIMRQITRSGDSGYYINHQECRLRDIVDLFLDSGIGRESFSIISQGQVEAIFNAKPEERRSIIEEVAGVFKYKLRKEEAERKLEKSQVNLDRVKDIMYELKDQLTPLKEQAENAEKYLHLKSELRDIDIAVTTTHIKELKDKIDWANEKLIELGKELKQNQETYELDKQQASELTHSIQKLEAERDEIHDLYLTTVQNLERQNGQLQLMDEREQNKASSLEKLNEDIQRYENQLNEISVKCTIIKAEANELKEKEALITQEIKENDRKLLDTDETLQSQIDELQQEYITALQQGTSLKNEMSYLQQEWQRENNKREKLLAEKTKADHMLKQFVNDFDEAENHLASIQGQIKQLLEEYHEKEKNSQQEASKLDSLRQKYQEVSSELSREEARANSLADMQESYSGYFGGVRAIMQQKVRISGIVGTVADLIDIPESYIQAIDTALGSSSQFVVVDNEQTAQKAIQHLKNQRAGRATFLPSNVMKARALADGVAKQVKNMSGFVGVASDLVDCSAQVRHIIQNLLGNILVAKNLDSATHMARAIHFKARIVTLDGDVINAGGSMTGGRGQKNTTSPIFTQKKALQAAQKASEHLKKTLQKIEKELHQKEETLQSLQEDLEEVKMSGEKLRQEEQKIEKDIARLTEQKSSQERAVQAIHFELTELSNYLEKVKHKQTVLKVDWEQQSQKNDEIKALIENHQASQNISAEEKEKISTWLEAMREESQQYREQIATLRSEHRHLLQEEERITEEIKHMKQQVIELQLQDNEQTLTNLRGEIESLKIKKISVEEMQQTLQEKYDDLRQEESKLQEKLEKFRMHNENILQQINQIEVQLSRNDVQMDHLLDYLVEEYQTSFEEVYMQVDEGLVSPEAKKQVKNLKRTIDQMGTVNLAAIQEYKQISERWEFLTKQQNDLLDAKKQLYETMDQMDYEVETRFKEMFDLIKKQFSIVFPQMFGGGRAELQLTDPDNLLETGIEIVAQPPGKKLTRLSLLSGGERALTAISLLFAIIQVHPIPFCILDEVESALDDANVARYGSYLQHFNTDTQFIVITHRKGTMEEADRLYGVTMQEKGVSKLVSVSLEEAELMEDVQ